MRKAAKRVALDDWEGASEIWKKLAYGKDEKLASKACFNMALACEMEDMLLPALDWATKSLILREDELTWDLIGLLQMRCQQFKKLDMQIPSGVM